MTQEEKELLLKDLCARLPYKVKVQYLDLEDNRLDYDIAIGVTLDGYKGMTTVDVFKYGFLIEKVKPFLRPISSMTKEEQKEFVGFHCVNLCPIIIDEMLTLKDEIEMFDWLNEHHFDYRGLLERGLAIEAPDGMYGIKKGGKE